VHEATVVGVPDKVRGEVPVAYIVADSSFNELAVLAHLRTQLASFKIPRGIVRVDSLPRTALGKVQKHLLPPFSPEGSALSFERERNDQDAERESRSCPRDRHAERSHAQHDCAEREVHARTEKAPDRGGECERRGAHTRVILLREPDAEDGEVAAGESQEE